MHADRVTPTAPFAHASEAELARILDYYGIGWEYEARVFPILWNLDGEVVESFAPDFFLPELDLYLELTTLKQSLVRKKNRKLRRLRELYPEVQIKLFYARDFRALMLKYGRIGLLNSLTGAEGQATPPRRAAAAGASLPSSIVGSAADGGDAGAAGDEGQPAGGRRAGGGDQEAGGAAPRPGGLPSPGPSRRRRSARRVASAAGSRP
jgi:hypoxanthine phosphoribosyltransferase